MGFQSAKDPASDFRATGLLGLYQLVAFAESRTPEARRMVAAATLDPRHRLPFALTAVNVTSWLLQLLPAADSSTTSFSPRAQQQQQQQQQQQEQEQDTANMSLISNFLRFASPQRCRSLGAVNELFVMSLL